jgi:hypothetical protein
MKRCLTPAGKLCSQLADWSTGKVTIATPIVLVKHANLRLLARFAA